MKPLLSICCTTYNHENYIAQAIDGFLMQKTNFPIEIIVHDDASTDGTADIVADYARKHPSLIVPILQEKNQHSQGIRISSAIIWPKAKGKYIAICEGDDYWTDPNKLQKQIDAMEKLGDAYSMCFHAVRIVDVDSNNTGRILGPYGSGTRTTSMDEVLLPGNVHASSKVVRTSLVKQKMPEWFYAAKHGDYASAMYFAANGKCHYIDEIMSCYRFGVPGSAMSRLRTKRTPKSEIAYHEKRIETYTEANRYYNFRFDREIRKVNLRSKTIIYFNKNSMQKDARQHYRDYCKTIGLLKFIALWVNTKFPKAYLVMRTKIARCRNIKD